MKVRVVKIVLPIAAIIVLIAVGLGTYFGIVEKNKTVAIKYSAFDRMSGIDLGEVADVKTELILMSRVLKITTKDSTAFIDNYILTHSSYDKTLTDTDGNKYYILIGGGYAYYVYTTENSVYVANLVSEYNNIYAFPFVSTNYLISHSGDNFVEYSEINVINGAYLSEPLYSSYKDVKKFYGRMGGDYWKYDDETKTIRLKICQVLAWAPSNFERISKDYVISMTFMEDGIIISAADYER
ncbi:MAG: hypothetical protein LBT55_00370 [Clostridiaceae bacterium]|jgi:hypothetical protein|nr:hypothetical protein [Clostridiaceae bacterium]